MSVNLEKETKIVNGKYIYIDDAKKDYIQNISLEGDIQQNAIVEVPGTTVTGETIYVTDVDTIKEHEINIKGNINQEIIEEEKGTTLEGESVVISDGDINKEVKAIVNGNSYQETTEGYNEVFIRDATSTNFGVTTIFKNQNINCEGTTTTSWFDMPDIYHSSLNFGKLVNFIPNEIYTLWRSDTKYILNFRITYTDDTKTDTRIYDGEKYCEFSVEDKEIKIIHYFVTGYTTGDTISIKDLKTMILKGKYTSDTLPPYEPYTNGASPNTEYKQDIEVIEAYNEFDKNNANTLNAVINTGSNSITSSANGKCVYIKCEKNKAYTVSKKSSQRFVVGTTEEIPSIGTSVLNPITGNTDTKIKITTTATSKYLVVYYFLNGTDTVTEQEVLDSLLIYKGTKDLPYLPYGHIGLVQRGKNILPNELKTETKNGITQTVYEDGSVNYKGTSTGSATFEIMSVRKNFLKNGTKYVLSSKNNVPKNVFLRLADNKNTDLYYQVSESSDTSKAVGFTYNGRFTSDMIRCYMYFGSVQIGSTFDFTIYPMLEENAVVTEYEPYIEPKTIPIDLQGNSIAKVGDIKDILNIGVDGSVSIEKKNIEVILDGVTNKFNGRSTINENNIYNTNQVAELIKKSPSHDNNKLGALCNYFKEDNINKLITEDIQGFGVRMDYRGFSVIFGSNSEYNTLEKANQFLIDNNVKIITQLAKTEPINLPSIEPIELFEGTNIFELVTNLGTTVSMTYDYVTPSPSVRRLSEIKTPVGKQDIYVGNKNLFDINKITENMFIKTSNGALVSNAVWNQSDYIKAKPTLDLIISNATVFTESGVIEISEYDKSKKWIKSVQKSNVNKNYLSHTMLENTNFVRIGYRNDKGFKDFQVENGEVATDYIEHQSQTYAISLGTMELAKIGNYQDHIVKRSNKWYKYKAIKKYKITGGESIALMATSDYGYRFVIYDIVDAISSAEIYCNAFRWRKEYNTNNRFNVNTINEDLIHLRDAKNGIGLWVRKEHYITSIEELKTYFTNNNIYVYYPLAEPVYEEITDTNLIAELDAMEKSNLYEGITNIYTISDFNPELELHYNFITPSPSIDSPAEIITVNGKQSFVSANKNLFDKDKMKFHSNNNSMFEGGANHLYDRVRTTSVNVKEFGIKYNETYKISGLPTGWKLASIRAYKENGGTSFGKNTVDYLYIQSENTFKLINEEIEYFHILFSTTTPSDTIMGHELFNESDIQIEEGTVATDYTPHQSQVQDIDVGELLGPIVDKEDGSYFENNWARKIFDGNETPFKNYPNDNTSYLYYFKNVSSNMDITEKRTLTLSNYFKFKDINTVIKEEGMNINTNGTVYFNFLNKLETNNEDGVKAFLKELHDSGKPLEILYPLATPTYVKLTDEQQAQWNKIKKMHTYEGVTNIYTINDNGISPVINLEYTTKYAEEYDFYIDENARFIVPEYDINYQVSIPESDLSDMPEASESAVKIAGKDGDVVLNTTYEPKDFNIVAYTDDNLDPKDKEAEKTKLVNFLHSIKNRTKNFGLLYRKKFYPVKYNDKLTPTIYPKSIRFEIPIKSSKSLGYALEKKMIFGNGKEISNTIEETGCKIIIEGPIYGTNDSPMVITLNDYQMAYYNTVLEGNRLEIDTNNSTIKHISSNGEVTNVAAYYNHEYPKIKYGENEIKILSKIDSETQVYTEWYDLKI